MEIQGSFMHCRTPRRSLQLRGTSWLKNAHPVVLIDYTKCTDPNTTLNGPLLPLNLEVKNSHDGKHKTHTKLRLSFLRYFLTRSLFLGLSRGFHFSSGWKGAPFASPLMANTVYRPRSTTFHMSQRWTDYLQEGQRTRLLKSYQAVSGNKQSKHDNPVERWKQFIRSKENLPTADYVCVCYRLLWFYSNVLGRTNYSKEVFPMPKLFLDTGFSFQREQYDI